jgi:Acetoacetate decarboxylase (ADC)
MGMPKRLKRQAGYFSLVDHIPYRMPIACDNTPALMAVFSINAEKAKRLIPGNDVYPLRLWKRGLLVITVINYIDTVIGKYIEYSIAIACTHGRKPAPRLLPGLFWEAYGTGQYVFDLPVSTEISVKGGKGIWGMPKHQANLDFIVTDKSISAQYDKDGQFAMKIEIQNPGNAWFPANLGATNYCEFRGMMMRSRIYFRSKCAFTLFKKGSATLTLGDHPRVRPLKDLEIDPDPIMTAFLPNTKGVLDDRCETWYVLYDQMPTNAPEGFESVIDLGLGEVWLPPPNPTLVQTEGVTVQQLASQSKSKAAGV